VQAQMVLNHVTNISRNLFSILGRKIGWYPNEGEPGFANLAKTPEKCPVFVAEALLRDELEFLCCFDDVLG